MNVKLQVGAIHSYGGTLAIEVVEMIGDSIFHPISHKSGVGEIITAHSGVD